MKRFLDILLSLSGLIIFSPLILLFALGVKLQDGGPVFFVQERWGREGRKFKALKFRTMVPNADERYGFRPAERNDFRITRVGKSLRATAMDELPQLINILKGDMSFVGPRALAVVEIDPSHPKFPERQKVRPGLTGAAQVELSRHASFEEKIGRDLEYIRNQYFWRDFDYVFQSLWITLCGKWEKLHSGNDRGKTGNEGKGESVF